MPGVFDSAMSLLEQAAIGGEQVIYNWQMLEPEGDVYDFSVIEQHFAATERLGEGLAVQVQDRFFRTPAQWVLRYLLEDPAYGGGLAPQVEYPEKPGSPQFGWVAQQWSPVVRARYQAFLRVVAAEFDRRAGTHTCIRGPDYGSAFRSR
jgi:hypothetical protein